MTERPRCKTPGWHPSLRGRGHGERFAPSWRRELYLPPVDYAREAGWELTPQGGRWDLFSTTCRPLVEAGDAFAIERACLDRGRTMTFTAQLDILTWKTAAKGSTTPLPDHGDGLPAVLSEGSPRVLRLYPCLYLG